MKNVLVAIHGGAKVFGNSKRPNKRWLYAIVLVMSLLSTSAAFAQGSIFGSVTNSNATIPANGEIGFFGYLDNTDEEIRIETSVGAGYDAGNWYDDFQNYLTEAPGNPYDYHFYNAAIGQGFVLSKLIPNNSFQQENIVLQPVGWPIAPVGMTGRPISGSTVVIKWTSLPGLTYHVYRRLATSNGSFFRIDDPTGNLANPGVADSFFVDNGVNGVSDYHYLLIAENASGQLSPHSTILTVSSSAVEAPFIAAIVPSTGYTVGGEPVTITGRNFDPAGATATIGGAPMTSVTVVSPYEITGLTPVGIAGPADVVVINNASGLTSAPLTGGFTYQANNPPVLALIGPQTVAEGANLNVIITATDADATIPALSTSTLPTNATFVDNGDGSGTFDFNPDFTQEGIYNVTFYATDGVATDSEAVAITVTHTNQAPILAPIGPQAVAENANLNVIVSSSDLDGEIPALTTSTLPPNATFLDNGDGTGTFDFNPDFTQEGIIAITFYASDGTATDSEVVSVTVTGTNQAPILAPIGPQTVAEGANLNIIASATDADGTVPAMTTSTLPANATFLDNGDGTGTFDFNPDFTQEGIIAITFYASDGSATDSEVVTVTVQGTNLDPVLDPIGPQTVAEGANLNVIVTASDPDGTFPVLSTSTLPANATFLDNGDGSGTFDFNPDYTQEGSYPVTFYATDGTATDSEAVTITVTHTNQAPVLATIGAQLVDEGANLNFVATATDGDGDLPVLSTTPLPPNATFLDNGDGTGSFDFSPDFTQGGTIYNVTFYATDGIDSDSEVVAITVNDAGNQAPVLDPIAPMTVNETENLNIVITASDPDFEIPALSAVNMPLGATLTDNLDGTGTFDFTPDYTQAGIYNITFIASDGFLADSQIVTLTVNDANRPPVIAPIGPQLVDEGANLNFIVTASDLDGTIPVLTTSVLPANATFLDNDNGTGVFDFNPDFTQGGAVYDITFYANDGTDIDSQVVSVTVNDGGNQAPVLDPIGSQVVYETANLNIVVTASDPDGDLPSLSASGLPLNATFIDNLDGTGTFDFTPGYDQSGDYPITFKAFDGVLVDSEVVTVSVLNTNRPPSLAPIGNQTMLEGDSLGLLITATDPDATIPTLTTSTLPANALFIDNLDGTATFAFIPDFTQNGLYNITFYAADGAATDSELITITVGDAGNQAPVLDSIGPRIVSEGVRLIIDVTASDPDGSIPTLTALNVPTNATFTNHLDGTGTFDFTPDFTQAGIYGVMFIASDGVLSDTEMVLVTVRELGNQAPVIDPIGPQTISEGDTLILDLSATDPEGHNIRFNYTTTPQVSGITLVDNLDGTGRLTYIPSFADNGLVTIRVFATDDGSPPLSGVVTIQVTVTDVNRPPHINALGPFGVKVGKTLQFTVTATDSTAGPDGVIYLTTGGLPANASFSDNGNGTGTFSFSPTISQVGVITVRFIAIDDGVPPMSDQVDVQITVVATNKPPVLADPGPQMILEGATLNVTVTATDPDGATPALSATSLPLNASFVDNGNGTGLFTFTPGFTQSGLYGVVLRATDGIDVVRLNMLIQVLEAGNQRPEMWFVGGQQVIENNLLQFVLQATDPDSTIPQIMADPLPEGAYFVDNGNGTGGFSWTPTWTQAGNYYIDFIAFDGILADTQEVLIEVLEGPNQMPVLNPISDITITETGTVHFTVTSSDLDQVAPLLTVAPLPGAATFTDNQDFTGTFHWVTTYDDEGVYDLTFYATDPDSTDLVATQTMTVTINNKNRPPTIQVWPPIQTTTMNEGTTLVYTVVGSDPDGDIPILKMNRVITNFDFVDDHSGNGTLTITANYTMAGLYAITFIAMDGDSANYPNDSATTSSINFIINNVPVAPILYPIGPKSITEGQTLSFVVDGEHPGGGSFEVFGVNMPPNSSLVGFGAPKVFYFTPSFTQAGVYNVLFYASDGVRADSEYVTITVIDAGNQPPYFQATTPDTQIISFGDSVVNHIKAVDPDNDPLTLQLFSPPANAVFVDSGNGGGRMKFVPNDTQIWGIYLFRYFATDPSGKADTLLNWIRVVAFLRGDSNNDGQVDIADISFLISYVFRQGPAPASLEAADVNSDSYVDVSDALYLVNFIFRHGPPPQN